MSRAGPKKGSRPFRRWLLLAAVVPALLAPGACNRGNDLPDFPEYAPAEPYLAQQQQVQERMAAQSAYADRRRRENVAANRAIYFAEWQRIMAQANTARTQAEAAHRQQLAQEARDRSRAIHYAEWQRIMAQANGAQTSAER